MNRETKKFIGKILIAAFFMVIMAWSIFTFFIPEKYLPILPWMLIFFTLVAITVHIYQVKLSKKGLGHFTRSSMIISVGRLMLYSIFAFVYLAINQKNASVFVVSLVFIYSVYTIIEVSELTRMMRRNNNSKK